MVNAIHAALPKTAVLLVPPMEPNPEAKGFAKGRLFAEYERALCSLVEKFRAAGFARIGCANVNTMHAAVLARKRYRDMTGNNINHCNDFSARIYRDAILAAMGLPKKPASDWKPRRTGRCATGSTGAWRRDGRMRRPRSAATGAIRRTEDGWEVIPLGNRPCAFRIPGGKAVALDFAGKEIGPASATVADGWYSITPVPGAFSYRIIAPHSNAL